MTEQELRALVRGVIRQQQGQPHVSPAPVASIAPSRAVSPAVTHPSQALFQIAPDGSGMCIIEPAVSCNGCGHCKTYGH